MRRLLILMAIAALAIASCGGDDDASTPSPTPIADPAVAAVRTALNGAYGLGSYSMEITFSPFGEPVPATVEYDHGRFLERLPSDLADGGAEHIYAGAFEYTRSCTGPDTCGEWQQSQKTQLIPSLAGTTTSMPETLAFTAIDVAEGWRIVSEDASGARLSAHIDLNQTTVENQRRAFQASGYTPAQVDDALRQLWGEEVPAVDPSLLEVTLTPDGGLISLVTIYVPGVDDDPYLEVEFSSFNEITVSVPEGFDG